MFLNSITPFDKYKTITKLRENGYGKYDVISPDCSEVPKDCNKYKDYIKRIEQNMLQDLVTSYPELQPDCRRAVWDLLSLLFEKKNRSLFLSLMNGTLSSTCLFQMRKT